MSALVLVLTLLLLAAVVLVVSAPLRAAARPPDSESAERHELELAREAKYREIRDAELDYRTGKLSARTTRRSTARCARRRWRSSTASRARPRAA